MIAFGGPYPYTVTIEVSVGARKTIVPVNVIAFNAVDAMAQASIQGQADGSLPSDSRGKLRAIKVEPDYSYVSRPTPETAATSVTDAIFKMALAAAVHQPGKTTPEGQR